MSANSIGSGETVHMPEHLLVPCVMSSFLMCCLICSLFPKATFIDYI